MEKEEIIALAQEMGFVLEYDGFSWKETSADSLPRPRFMRFVLQNGSGSKKTWVWTWHADSTDAENVARGEEIAWNACLSS